ncbi:hypothetical protein [Caulobacter sp. DWR3-1-2]|uniref:hypothetical protein n=1 Tax=Caulobacter sp. DWR3-1-2 TaxID=2804647 RepID=UPI003CF9696B
MPVLPLLFDPRGAIDRRTFWSGLLQLAVISLTLSFALASLGLPSASAVLPAIGEALITADITGHVYTASPPSVALVASILIATARLYASACLMLKRSRDARKSAGPLIALGLAELLVQGLVGLWIYDLFDDDDVAMILPIAVDAAITAGLGLGFTIWVGISPLSPEQWRPFTWLRVVLDPRGRAGRRAFVLGELALHATLFFAPTMLSFSTALVRRGGVPLLLLLVSYVIICLYLKRLRDAGRGPGSLIAMIGFSVATISTALVLGNRLFLDQPLVESLAFPAIWMLAISLAAGVLAVFWLGYGIWVALGEPIASPAPPGQQLE